LNRVVDDELVQALKEDEELRKEWLFLDKHPDFEGHWGVEAFSSAYLFDFKDLVGPYRVVSPASLGEFLQKADDLGYQVAFLEEPTKALEAYAKLNESPSFELHSPLENTVNGLLPYQLQGFNFLKDLDGGVALWATGTGKTVLAAALLRYHLELGNFDTAFVVVKNHNKINTQRLLHRVADIEATVVDGPKSKRKLIFEEANNTSRVNNTANVLIMNYEKFRVDRKELLPLFEDKHILCIWDEMPTKLKTRNTQIYKAVVSCLYKTNPPATHWDKRRPKSLRQWMLSATPIENDPEDFFNTVRLLDPRVYGGVKRFQDDYVRAFSFFSPTQPVAFKNLDKMGLKSAHMTHQVDKGDPDIAAQFPKTIEEPYYIDWNSKHRKIYDLLTKESAKIDFDEVNVLALITVLQMLCDAPSMVTNSAVMYQAYEEAVKAWDPGTRIPLKHGSEAAVRLLEALGSKALEDEGHTKLEALQELLQVQHSGEKVLVFSTFNDGLLPIIEASFRSWGVSYVRYGGTDKQRQDAEDSFMQDDSIQVFLSSDMGSDSLSLEAASVVIHYDLPWKYSTYIQRQNRIHRVISEFDTVRYYRLMMANSVEDRKHNIIQRKQAYHEQVFKGAAEQSLSARMTKEDLEYILLGD
jgi:SNF2 family DNA or RNA helicase